MLHDKVISEEKLNIRHRNVPCDFYDQGIEKNFFQKFWHEKRYQVISNIFLTVIDGKYDQMKILDLGCNAGYFSDRIQKLTGAEIYGIDISEDTIKYAKGKYPSVQFCTGDISKSLPYSNNQFNIILSFDVLEHIIDLDLLLHSIKRVLKNKGYLFFACPHENLLFNMIWWFWTRTKGSVLKDVHVRHIGPNNYQGIFYPFGFKTIKIIKSHLGMWYLYVLQLDK